jgi:cation diffusion facilitator family transporter
VATAGASPTRAIVYAFAANLGIALSKTAAALYTGSSSLAAESIHSFADTGNQLLLLLGLHRARRPPDAEHPLGYGKLTFFWSFVVALMLFSLGGLFSLWEGWRKLRETGPLESAWLALVVLGVSIALEATSMRGCLREVAHVRRGRSLWRWLHESRSSELLVVFGEDLAALLGLSLALAFVTLAVWTGERRFDAFGSLAIGALLIGVAAFVALRVKELLIGRSADPQVAAAIERAIAAEPAIARVFHVITVQVGPQVMVAAKVQMRDGLSLAQAVEHINALEARLKREVPEVGWSFMEPDVAD